MVDAGPEPTYEEKMNVPPPPWPVKALVSQRICADSPEPSLFDNAISIRISYVASFTGDSSFDETSGYIQKERALNSILLLITHEQKPWRIQFG